MYTTKKLGRIILYKSIALRRRPIKKVTMVRTKDFNKKNQLLILSLNY